MKLHVLPAFRDNYLYILHDGHQAIVIDPGDAAPIIDFLDAHNLELKAIYNTHHHPDHIGGNTALQDRFRCEVYASEYDVLNKRIDAKPIAPGESISIFNHHIDVLDVRAHTLGHIAYYLNNINVDVTVQSHSGLRQKYQHTGPLLFCGDSLFRGGCGRLFEGTYEQLAQSLKTLFDLPDQTLVCCAHEYTINNYRFACSFEEQSVIDAYLVSIEEEYDKYGATVPFYLGDDKDVNPFLAAFSKDTPFREEYTERIMLLRKAKDNFSC